MKTEHVLFGVVVLGMLGVIFFGLAPKVCVDIQSGETRTTHALFPCNAREKALPAGYGKEST
jgi:hypothetical protein